MTAPASDEKVPDLTLQAAVMLDVKLESPISFQQSAVGDSVTARLDRAVQAGGISLHKGPCSPAESYDSSVSTSREEVGLKLSENFSRPPTMMLNLSGALPAS